MSEPRKDSNRETVRCHSMRKILGEALDRRLGRTDQRDVRQHLLACPSCRAEYTRLERLQKATRALPDERVSDDFRERLLARIEAGEGARPDVLHHPAPFARLKLFASGAATAAALLISFWLVIDGLNEKNSPNRSPIPDAIAGIPNTLPGDSSLPVPVSIDANRFGLQAVQKSHELYDGLRQEATRAVGQPVKLAWQRLAQRSEQFVRSVRLVDAMDGRFFELPSEVRSRFVDAERTARMVLEQVRRDNPSREGVARMAETLQSTLSKRSGSIKVEMNIGRSEPVDLFRVFARRTRNPAEIRELVEFIQEHLIPNGVFPTVEAGSNGFRIRVITRER